MAHHLESTGIMAVPVYNLIGRRKPTLVLLAVCYTIAQMLNVTAMLVLDLSPVECEIFTACCKDNGGGERHGQTQTTPA